MVLESNHSRELELENTRLTSVCVRISHRGLGEALNSEIQRLAGGSPTDREAAQKYELACLRMAADCMQLIGDIKNSDLQRHFLELARQLTSAAELTAVAALTTSI